MSGAAGSVARSVTIGCGVASAEPANAEPGVASATPGRVAWSPEDGDGDRVALRLRRLLRQRQLDRQDPALVARLRAVRVDVVRQRDPALERAVLDLDLLVGRLPVHGRPAPLARNEQVRSPTSIRVSAGSIPATSTTTTSWSPARKQSTFGRIPCPARAKRGTCQRSSISS